MKKATTVILALLFAGCADLPKQPSQAAVYDFGMAKASSPVSIHLRLSGMASAPGLASSDIRYRLNYRDPSRVYAYTESRWLAAPADLLAQRIQQQLTFNESSPCKIRLTLTNFDQVFDAPDRSRGVIRLHATVSYADKSQPPAQQDFTSEAPAASSDARGGVMALITATDQAIDQLANWAQQLACSSS